MARTLHVVALQLPAGDRADFAANRVQVLECVRAVAEADLVVLPEGTLPGYVLGPDQFTEGNDIETTVAELRVIAKQRETVIVVGIAVQHDSTLRNRALVIDRDGSIAGHADKIFLWHFDRKWFAAGNRLAPVKTSIGSLGVLVCADGRIPTIASTLVDRGAELLVMPTAWVTSGRDPTCLENVQADLLARVRAFENGVPFVAANKCGVELGMVAYCGKSQIIDAAGEIVAMASDRQAGAIHAGLTIEGPRPYRHARPTPRLKPAPFDRPIQIAISTDPPTVDLDERLAILDATYAVLPGAPQRLAELSRSITVCEALHDAPFDPGYCAELRRCGCRLLVWNVARSSAWIEAIARTRALELRMYVIVLNLEAGRAFAVDPDGAIIAGTFGDYRLASFTLDPYRVQQTGVAPGTDVADGLERAHSIAQRAIFGII